MRSFPAFTVRTLTPADVQPYRALRLRALQESPTAFGSSYEREAAFSEADFIARMQPHGDPANGIFAAFSEGGHPDGTHSLVGMLGFTRESGAKRAHIALLWSMYVAPEYRGQHIGSALLDTVLAHAQSFGLRQVLLAVTAGNTPAQRLYTSRGFELYGTEPDALCIEGRFYDEEMYIKRLF